MCLNNVLLRYFWLLYITVKLELDSFLTINRQTRFVIRMHMLNMHFNSDICLNLPQSGPEIDPFWYVGRGVRPIGRFGKRQSGGDLEPVVKSLELLLNTLRNKESLRNALAQEESDWLP